MNMFLTEEVNNRIINTYLRAKSELSKGRRRGWTLGTLDPNPRNLLSTVEAGGACEQLLVIQHPPLSLLLYSYPTN